MVHDPASEYHSVKAISNSGMNKLIKSPAHFKDWWDSMGQNVHGVGTDALLAGSLFHALVLEPETVGTEYGLQEFSGATKEGKAQIAAFKEQGITPVKKDMWTQCEAMAESVRRTPILIRAMSADDWRVETSIYWEEEGGIKCKARLDGIATIPGVGLCIFDLKSTADAHPDSISKSMAVFGYHRQAAWYRHALSKVGLDAKAFVLLFTEKASPYVVTPATVCEAAQGDALLEIKNALDTYRKCEETNTWPGYVSEIIDLDLPAWARRKKESA